MESPSHSPTVFPFCVDTSLFHEKKGPIPEGTPMGTLSCFSNELLSDHLFPLMSKRDIQALGCTSKHFSILTKDYQRRVTKVLQFDNSTIKKFHLRSISQSLSHYCYIHELHLKGAIINDFKNVVSRWTNNTRSEYVYNRQKRTEYKHLLHPMKHCSQLNTLIISHWINDLYNNHYYDISILNKFEKIYRLGLINTGIGSTHACFRADSIIKLRFVTQLDLSHNTAIKDLWLVHVCEKMKQLRCLKLESCTNVTGQEIHKWAKNLDMICLNRTDVSEASSIAALFSANNNITRLWLAGCNISITPTNIPHWPETLVHLDLSDHSTLMRSVLEKIKSEAKSLRLLKIRTKNLEPGQNLLRTVTNVFGAQHIHVGKHTPPIREGLVVWV